MAADVRELRARELYRRLPEVYRVRDWQAAVERVGEAPVQAGQALPELEAFLGVIADDVRRLRGHIADLWDDFFIETCAEWVVPYLGDLLGVRLIFNAAQRNRVDVTKTVEWRRRKGTLRMLGELAGDITGWAAEAAECFENLGWAQNLNHIKGEHAEAPDLRDPYRLSLLGGADDPWLHAADVRRPNGSVGRYGIKTVGFYLSRLNAYPLRGVAPAAADGSGDSFLFDPLGRDLPLFDRRVRQPISAAAFAHDPLAYFGDPLGCGVRQHGVLLASDRPPAPEPTEPAALWTGFGPAAPGDTTQLGPDGPELMEPQRFERPAGDFVITALWGADFATATELGKLATLGGVFTPTPGGDAAGAGSLLLSLSLDGDEMALFPATVLAIRNDRAVPRVSDNRASRYRDALYVWLPEALLSPGDELRLYVGEEGSTIYATRATPHVGPADVLSPAVFPGGRLDRSLLAATGQGQCFPPRPPRHSLEPSDLVDLHRLAGLRLVDEALFVNRPGLHGARKFVIEARLAYGEPLVTVRLGRLATTATDGLVPFTYTPEPNVAIPAGARLMLTISPVAGDTLFPMADLLVTDRAGRALLVTLPEMEFTTYPAPVWLCFDTAGATYYASTDFGHDTTLARPDRGGAFRLDPLDSRSGLARRSLGQVLPLLQRAPVQHRAPGYANLRYWDHPKPRPPRAGQLALDPARGRFQCAPGEGPVAPLDGSPLGLRVDYHEGFAHDIGALPYDRYVSLKAPDHPQPTRYVASSGDTDHGAAPVHATVADAVAAAQDGDVIQIEDSATYEHSATLDLAPAGVTRLVMQAANRQRPCLRFSGGAELEVSRPMDALRLNGLLVSGTALHVADASQMQRLELLACSFDPVANPVALIAAGPPATPVARLTVCRCVLGALQLGAGVAELIVVDSIVDGGHAVAIGDLSGNETRAQVHLERATVWGLGLMHQLYGSECLLVDAFTVSDQQAGCLRYSRYQSGSRLPRRFQCVPGPDTPRGDVVTPAFNSHRFGHPAYAQLHLVCPGVVRAGAEDGAEMGGLHGTLASLRVKNLGAKLDEYLPVGLTPAVIYVT